MTIQAWNIVLNAVVAVLIVGYGIWLKNIVEQQLKSKDTTIEAQDAVIKIKDAEISALKSDTAPAIAKAYANVREHADRMTAEVNELTRREQELSEELQRAQGEASKLAFEKQRQPLFFQVSALTNEAKGLLRAWKLSKEVTDEPTDNVFDQLLEEANDRLVQGDKILNQLGIAEPE
jgi:hypothetical protein